ncbi:TPA: hypothetical protein EYP38_04985 [Candidatus Micrarchaeota archaeon]|nr:hypothetical protein [Candidatus Micrarchaeota archaeon]
MPSIELKRKIALVEAEMPLALRTMGMLIDMKIPFLQAVEIVSEEDGVLSEELCRIVQEVKGGVTVQRAFARFARSYSSFNLKRAISQLLSAYEVGSPGTELRRIGDDLMEIERHKMKEYSSKSAIFGLLFIVSSAILPTFFLIYSVLGQFALGTSISLEGIVIGLLFLSPMISVAILLISRSTMPASPFQRPGGLEVKMLIPAAIFLLSFLFLPGELSFLGILAGAAAAVLLSYRGYREEVRQEEIERYLPDGLFAISGLPKSTSMDKVFGIIASAGYGALSEEAEKSRKQVESNVKTGAVLEDLWRRNDSPMLKRAAMMLKHVFDTNSFDRLNSLAEDILKNFAVKRDRAQMSAIQKYTLLFGALIIPLILKITLYLLTSMIDLFEDQAAVSVLEFAFSLVPPYLILYSLISSSYIADIEEKKSMAVIYFLLMAAVGLVAFYFIDL